MSGTSQAAGAPKPWLRTEVLPDVRGIAFPEALARVVEQVPDRTAIIAPDRSVTYRELLADVHRVTAAVPPSDDPSDAPVVVTAGHGITPLVQFLAVLHAGRIVLPVDVREPVARLAGVYRASGATAVLTSGAMVDVARRLAGDDPVVVYEALPATASRAPDDPLTEHDRACIFYTSGSTGTPKGVFDDHRSVVRHNTSYAWSHQFTPDDRVALMNSYAFAAMRTRFLAVLLAGATVCTYDLTGRGVRGVPSWVRELGVSVLWFTPTVLRALHEVRCPEPMRSVRLVTLGSETLFGRDVRGTRPLFAPSTIFRNRLSSSEAHGIAGYEVPADIDDGPVPAGTPEPWVEIHLVDVDGGPVAPGEPGRLDVISPQSALGYWRDPQLTAARFFRTDDGRRGFHSSDAARWRPDGLLEHLGRLDDRVKVRGAMVSPSEVETALTQLPDVAVAAVVARPGAHGETRVVGFVQPVRSAAPTPWELRRALRERVPSHMVPGTIVVVDEIPRTARGKLDRAALTPPADTRPPYRAPVGLEQPLAELFEETLGVDGIGADDDFFDLGGDSLAAVELLAAIEERFGVDLRDRDLLAAPTVASLAPRLARRRPPSAPPVITVRATDAPGRLPFFCVPGAGDPASSMASLARALDDRAVYVFQARGLEERALPDRSVGAAARRYLREVRALRPRGPYLLAGYSFGGLVAFDMACRLEAAGDRVALLVILDTPAPGTRPGRTERLSARVGQLRAGDDDDADRVALTRRAVRFAFASALAHGRRRVAVTGAGIIPRPGVAQYELFYRMSRGVSRRYRPTRVFGGAALVVRATERDDGLGPGLGWDRLLTGPVEHLDVPGAHEHLRRNPNVRGLGEQLVSAFSRYC